MCDKPTINLFEPEELDKILECYTVLENLVFDFGVCYTSFDLKGMRDKISYIRNALAELDSSLYPIGD